MGTTLTDYLDSVRHNLRLDVGQEAEVIRELAAHIEDRIREMRKTGLSETEAARRCLEGLGSARILAREIYEAHSGATWRQTLLAAMPHFVFGAVFALNWWQHILGMLALLFIVVVAVVYFWHRVKSRWLYPWLSYSLLPVVGVGLLLLWLPQGLAWVAWPVYIGFAVWLIHYLTSRSRPRDWLYVSLMLLPVPTIIAWVLAVRLDGSFPAYTFQKFGNFAPWIGFTFLAFTVAAVFFMRFRRRWLKGSVLVVSGLLSLTMVTFYTRGALDLYVYIGLNVLMLGLFILPALLESRVRRQHR